jgi:hypothetical protein
LPVFGKRLDKWACDMCERKNVPDLLVPGRDPVTDEPPQPGRNPPVADTLISNAVRQRWLTPPTLAGQDPPPRKPVMTFRQLMDDVQDDREDRSRDQFVDA